MPVSYERDIEDCVIFECCAAPGEAFNIIWYVLRIAHAALLMNVSMSAGLILIIENFLSKIRY